MKRLAFGLGLRRWWLHFAGRQRFALLLVHSTTSARIQARHPSAHNPSADAPDRTDTHSSYVVPGDAAGSLLIDKIANESPAYGGERMPTNGDFISADDEQMIRDWIDQGALDN